MTTPTRLTDTREYQQMTPDEADALFSRIALLEAGIKQAAAATNKKIAILKEQHERATEADRMEYKELSEQLANYLTAHPERFVSPRQRKTAFGKYGFRTVTETRITDEQQVIAFSDERKLALYVVIREIDKAAVTKAIGDFGEVPGAKIVSGGVTSISVDKTVLDQPIKR